MQGAHLRKNQQFKGIYITGAFVFIILLSLIPWVISGITLSYGDNNSSDTVVYNNAPNPNMNYGTKEY